MKKSFDRDYQKILEKEKKLVDKAKGWSFKEINKLRNKCNHAQVTKWISQDYHNNTEDDNYECLICHKYVSSTEYKNAKIRYRGEYDPKEINEE